MDNSYSLVCSKELKLSFFKEVFVINFQSPSFVNSIQKIINQTKSDFLIIYGNEINRTFIDHIVNLSKYEFDIIHGNSNFHEFDLLKILKPGYLFNITPSKTERFTSWQLNLKSCMLNLKRVNKIFDNLPSFQNDCSLFFFIGYRALQNGYIIQYHNCFKSPITINSLPKKDENKFIKLNFNTFWVNWMFLFQILYKKEFNISLLFQKQDYKPTLTVIERKVRGFNAPNNLKITALIPSLNRESYIFSILSQLSTQTIRPSEVYIIDQSDVPYDFNKSRFPFIINHIISDKCGQSSARNKALESINTSYLLLLDDDIDIHPDFIEQHLKCLGFFNADYTIGPIFENKKQFDTPPRPNYRMADLFPGGNSLIKISKSKPLPRFDVEFNYGPRADFDFGVQLYQLGYIGIFNPNSPVFHYRAPEGGLRHYNARRITLESSKKKLFEFNIPHRTELYLINKYGSSIEAYSFLFIKLFGIFRSDGNLVFKALKLSIGVFLLPIFIWRLSKNFNKSR